MKCLSIYRNACFLIAIFIATVDIGCVQNNAKEDLLAEKSESSSFSIPTRIYGSGATFPYPAYAKWAFHYYQTSGIRINYEQTGSDAGIRAVQENRTHFGASDIPLTERALKETGLVQFPIILGGVVLVFNLPDIRSGALNLTSKTICDIYSGKISRWNDNRIKQSNPHILLPNRDIVPIYRADTSGTTWIFSDFLARACDGWKPTIDSEAEERWPAGIGAKGNDQVARFVKQFKYTLAYVEFSHAKIQNLKLIALDMGMEIPNQPSLESFELSASWDFWSQGEGVHFRSVLNENSKGWPIIGASYVVMKAEQKSSKHVQEALRFFYWALTKGQSISKELEYATVPNEHIRKIENLWHHKMRADGQIIWEMSHFSKNK